MSRNGAKFEAGFSAASAPSTHLLPDASDVSLPECLQAGDLWLKQGNLEAAIQYYRQVLQRYPESPEVYQSLAEALSFQGSLAESAACYRQAIELLTRSKSASPQPPCPPTIRASSSAAQTSMETVDVEQLLFLLSQAESAAATQQWQTVLTYCEQLLALQPSAKTYKLQGNALQALGQRTEALTAYTKALQLQPNWAEVYANLGSLKAQEHQWQAAITDYQQAIQLKPNFAGAYRNLARIWTQLNCLDKAAECWSRASLLEAEAIQTVTSIQPSLSVSDPVSIDSLPINPSPQTFFQSSFDQPTQAPAVFPLQPCPPPVPSLDQIGLATQSLSEPAVSELNSAEQWVDQGTYYAEQGMLEQAITSYQQALQIDPQQAAAHWNLAEIWRQLHNPIAAADALFQALQLQPDWATPSQHFNLGKTLAAQDRLDLAIDCYRYVAKTQPSAPVFYAWGEALFRKGQLQNAIQYYRQAIALHPCATYYQSLVQALLQLEDWSAVLDCYAHLVQLDSQNIQHYLMLVKTALQRGNADLALQVCRQAIIVQPTCWEAHHQLADLLAQREEWSAAVAVYRQAITLNPTFSWSHNNLGDALLHLQQWSAAAHAFEQAIALKSDFHWSHYNLGEALMELEQWGGAVTAYRSAIVLNPELPGIDRKLANALKRYGTQLLATASQHYQRAIEQDPDQIETYHQAIELQPDRPELYEGLANALSRTGDITGATVFRQLVKQLQASLPKSLESTHRSSMIPIAASMQCNFNFFKPGEKLTLPYSQTPLVSCIIPVYNEIDYTYHCLQSLSRSLASNTQIEIIVVNDCSTDQTQTVLEQVENLVLINNEKNAGFIRSCNRGASQAKGQYLYFLNNDTEIQAKAIEYLIESLENDETIGAVGSKLVYPNGLLQEAGGIIWNDASGWNYGRMQNPCDPQYNYLRQVDYCSAASLLVRRWVFETLQGFSETFIPAYYEDTDLCFRIRHELGLQVVYQPRSEVVHYEGISSGTSTDEGVKHYQIINAKKFKDKWQKVLIDYPPNQGLEQVPQAARRHSGKRTVLIINPYPPCYDKESGARRLFEIIKLFKQLNYHVIFAPDNGLKEEPYVSELQDLQVEVLYHQVGYGLPMMEQIKERLPLVDCAWLCFPAIAQRYLPLLRQYPTIRIIYDTIDLHYLRLQRAWEMQLTVNPIEPTPAWVEMQSLELALAKQADLTLTVTSVEQKLLQEQGVQNVAVVPNIHHPYQGNRPSFMERSGLLFIGGYNHPPNVDAVLWLYQAIMPAVWQEIPDLTVTLLGSHPPKEVQQLGAVDPRIIVTGYIADVSPYFLSRRIFVAPLRYGAGMKGKVGQSLEYGLPLVSTSIGVEGMGLVENETVLVADQAATFAAQILRLYQDQDLWKRLSDAALAAVEPFTAKTVCSFLSNLMDRLLESHDQENHRSCKP